VVELEEGGQQSLIPSAGVQGGRELNISGVPAFPALLTSFNDSRQYIYVLAVFPRATLGLSATFLLRGARLRGFGTRPITRKIVGSRHWRTANCIRPRPSSCLLSLLRRPPRRLARIRDSLAPITNAAERTVTRMGAAASRRIHAGER
jgi:hypothetical protein